MRTAALMIVLMMACRATGGGGGGGSGSGAPDGPSNANTVKAIRMNQPTNGAMVSLSNVVVTAHVTSKKYGKVWVQDPGGGAYSGIEVYCNYGGTNPNCTMTQQQINALAVGTVVNVTGKFNSFLLSTAPAGAQPSFEIESPTITATGQTMTPVAVDVAATTVAKDQLASPAADPYKGAYVHVTGSFNVSSITAMEFTSTCTDKSTPPQMGMTYSGVEVASSPGTLALGLGFYDTVTYCLPCTGVAMPFACTNALTMHEAFSSLAGIVEPSYNANGMVYLEVSPTSDADLAR